MSTVNKTLAQGCVTQFETLITGSTDSNVASAFSSGIVHDRAELQDWINGLDESVTSIAIEPGIYTADFATEYPSATEGRMTAFLTPRLAVSKGMETEGDDNDPPPPFNLGSMEP